MIINGSLEGLKEEKIEAYKPIDDLITKHSACPIPRCILRHCKATKTIACVVKVTRPGKSQIWSYVQKIHPEQLLTYQAYL